MSVEWLFGIALPRSEGFITIAKEPGKDTDSKWTFWPQLVGGNNGDNNGGFVSPLYDTLKQFEDKHPFFIYSDAASTAEGLEGNAGTGGHAKGFGHREADSPGAARGAGTSLCG